MTNRASKPFIQPNEVHPDGKFKPLSRAEEVLNWQSENIIAQNESLQTMGEKLEKVTEKMEETDQDLKVLSHKMQRHYKELKEEVAKLDRDLRTMLDERMFGKAFDQKEREIRTLQKQLKEMDDFIQASKEHKAEPVRSRFSSTPAFSTVPAFSPSFTQPKRPS